MDALEVFMSCGNHKHVSCLCPFSFGLAFGIVDGVFMLVIAWFAYLWGFGTPLVEHYATFFRGYEATWVGGFIGGLWGLLVGFIFGFFLALVYDWIVKCCKCLSCKKCDEKCDETCGHQKDESGTAK